MTVWLCVCVQVEAAAQFCGGVFDQGLHAAAQHGAAAQACLCARLDDRAPGAHPDEGPHRPTQAQPHRRRSGTLSSSYRSLRHFARAELSTRLARQLPEGPSIVGGPQRGNKGSRLMTLWKSN